MHHSRNAPAAGNGVYKDSLSGRVELAEEIKRKLRLGPSFDAFQFRDLPVVLFSDRGRFPTLHLCISLSCCLHLLYVRFGPIADALDKHA